MSVIRIHRTKYISLSNRGIELGRENERSEKRKFGHRDHKVYTILWGH